MKRIYRTCIASVLALSLLTGGAASASAISGTNSATVFAAEKENCISDSWKTAASPDLTDKVQSVFLKAFDGFVGASYTPVALLASRTTASGIQYRVLCKTTVVYPNAEEQYVVVTLRKNWLGRAEVVEIGDALSPTDLSDEPLMGGWQETTSPVLTEDALSAFDKATEGLLGVHYTPVALLSTQVVSGTNYRILCEATTVYPGAEMNYVVMTICESLDGTASILSVSDSFASASAQ